MNTKLFVVDDYDDAVPRRFSASGQVWMSISRGGGGQLVQLWSNPSVFTRQGSREIE